MTSLHHSKFICPVQPSKFNKVGNVSAISPLGMVVLEIREPFVLSRNFGKPLEFRSAQKSFRSLQRKIMFGHQDESFGILQTSYENKSYALSGHSS